MNIPNHRVLRAAAIYRRFTGSLVGIATRVAKAKKFFFFCTCATESERGTEWVIISPLVLRMNRLKKSLLLIGCQKGLIELQVAAWSSISIKTALWNPDNIGRL